MFSFDQSVSLELNTYAYVHPFVRDTVVFCAAYLPYLLGIVLILFCLKGSVLSVSKMHVALKAIFAGLTARFVIKPIITFFYALPRPYVTLPDIHLLISPDILEAQQSFPSGHALFFFGVAAVLYEYNKKIGIFFLISATIISVARVMAGVHYGTDIFSGAAIGILVGIFFSKFVK